MKKYEKYNYYLMEDGILYDEKKKKYYITTNSCEGFEDEIAIRYCPICGRKLNTD